MKTQIFTKGLNKDLTAYGKNGFFKTIGVQMYADNMNVFIHPINTKGLDRACWVGIPKEEIDNFIAILQEAKKENVDNFFEENVDNFFEEH